MDAVKTERSIVICRGCLSVDRSLLPIKRNMDLFLTLLGNNQLGSTDIKEHIYLCFECISLLRKVAMFRCRIQTAQDMLTKMLSLNWTPNQSLSQLTITKKDEFNFITIKEPDEIKTEFNGSMTTDDNNCFNTEVKEEIDDIFERCFDQNLEENVDIVKRESKKMTNVKKKCKISNVTFSVEEKECFVVPVVMKLNDLLMMPKKNKGVHYKNMVSSCSRLISKLAGLKKCDLKKKDKPEGLECTHCRTAITDHNDMKQHWDDHTVELFQCTLCNIYSKQRHEIIHHITDWHTMVYQCHECGFKCWKMPEFNNHYKHFHKYFICDHCNRKFYSKSSIERHMRRKHLPLICHICFKHYKHSSHLREHLSSHERAPTDLTYCVECDLQFVSQYGYKRHLRTSVAHRPRKIQKVPCPDCGKVFTRKVYMNNHYRQVHVRKTPHYCELCDKYFINGYAIRTHKKFVHEKNEKPKNKICDICNRGFHYFINGYAIRTHKKFVHEKNEKPKNKICDICNRGFHTNRVLINHKRTHTGERPFSCNYCSAAFAQLQAKKTHERTQHKNVFFLNS